MEKLGMRREGVMREHWRHGDGFDDIVVYGLLASEFSPPPDPAPLP
jgi:RimJ/RimL family protein N-acetyltransferase